jgi:hypothetical protein
MQFLQQHFYRAQQDKKMIIINFDWIKIQIMATVVISTNYTDINLEGLVYHIIYAVLVLFSHA